MLRARRVLRDGPVVSVSIVPCLVIHLIFVGGMSCVWLFWLFWYDIDKSLSTCDRASSSIVTSISVFKMIQKSQTCIQNDINEDNKDQVK